MPDVRLRFAPSPTGFLHVGSARTALFNWLYARHTGGRFILRVEDTDASRNTPEATAAIYDGLKWLGLDWDEGPDIGGDFGPYRQSERKEIYDRYFARLEAGGHLYEDGGAIRFRSAKEPVTVDDIVCGQVTFDLAHEPDMTIRRPDGSYIFHFVSVVDDIEMKISHVLRGEDHLTNTAKHLKLYDALGEPPPRFAHMPLSLNMDGTKISKRDAGARIDGYIKDGFLPAAVRNYICLLGWSPKDDTEKLSLDELISRFEIEDINRGNASFDLDKCVWLNGQYLAELTPGAFIEAARPFVEAARPFVEAAGVAGSSDPAAVDRAIALVQEKVKLLSEVPNAISFLFEDAYPYEEAAAKKAFGKTDAMPRLKAVRDAFAALSDWSEESLTRALHSTAATLDCKPGALMLPLRVALSGRAGGPGLHDIMLVLGKDRVLARLDRTLAAHS